MIYIEYDHIIVEINEVDLAEFIDLECSMYKGTMCVRLDPYHNWKPIEEWEYTDEELKRFLYQKMKNEIDYKRTDEIKSGRAGRA